MGKHIGRRMNDGNMTGLKQDKFRNSDFEYERWKDRQSTFGGVSRATPNTLGGKWAENRGRRGDEDWADPREDNPFENGFLYNWNRREGRDEAYFDEPTQHSNRNHGGALIGHDEVHGHRGKGPKGYTRPDSRIHDDVCEMLSMSPNVDASNIEVTVKEGVIFLEGEVEDRETKRMAELEIENVSGVKDVQNKLRLSSRQRRGDTGDRGQPAQLS